MKNNSDEKNMENKQNNDQEMSPDALGLENEKELPEIENEQNERIQALLKSAEEKDKKINEYYDQILRQRAEFENYRKRVEKEKETHRLWGKEEILLKQISLYDIIAQALESVKKTKNVESFIVGLEMIFKEFGKMLVGEGITQVPVNGKYDPNIHEAVETVEDDSKDEDTIVSVIQNGYMMNERIIRPARVKIVKNKKEQ